MIKAFISKQFLVFLITGGIAASINFGSRLLYNLWMNFSSAIIMAYLTGMITAFILAKYFVFKESQQRTVYSAFNFTLVNLIAIIQTWCISMWLAHYFFPSLGIHRYLHELSHAIGITVPVFTSYLGHKYFSFK